MISTRGRYALMVLIDLCEHAEDKYIPIKNVVERQGISQKYIEQIMPLLVRGGLVVGVHGKGGGYKLTRNPSEYKVGEILRLTEGDLAPVSCLATNAPPCDKSTDCKIIAMWSQFNKITNDYFDGITIQDLMGK